MMATLVWAMVGLFSVLSELLSGSLFLLFIGLSALIVAGVRLLGLDNIILESLLFATLSIASIILFRKKALAGFRTKGHFRIDSKLRLDVDMPAGCTAIVHYQGTVWTAVNMGDHLLKAGDLVQIVKIEGVKLFLTSIQS